MISNFFSAVFYNPLYNGLVFIINHTPGADLGVAVIVFTCVVKFVLIPLSKSSVVTQLKMKALEPELNKIQEQTSNNKEEQARMMLEFYKKNNLNPFSGVLLLLIQLPIILSLANIFYTSGLPHIDATLLYSYIPNPQTVNTLFLGLLDITKKNVWLSIIVGVTQFIQIRYSVPAYKPTGKTGKQEDFAKSMNVQMRYTMPAIVFLISFSLTSAISLYWITSNIFAIVQEVYFRKTIKKDLDQNKK
jgi:YidC/Oxa1 family membrane protein insertase